MKIETYLKTTVAVMVLSILGAVISMVFLPDLAVVTKLFVCTAATAWAALIIGGVFYI